VGQPWSCNRIYYGNEITDEMEGREGGISQYDSAGEDDKYFPYFQLQAHFHMFYISYCGFKVLLCVCVLVFC